MAGRIFPYHAHDDQAGQESIHLQCYIYDDDETGRWLPMR